jgi:hypothetical protein
LALWHSTWGVNKRSALRRLCQALSFVRVPKRFQNGIHARLVASTLFPEPGKHVLIDTQCNLRLA